MTASKMPRKRARLWRAIVTVVLLTGAVWLLVAHRSVFSSGIEALHHARTVWLLAGFGLTGLTFGIAAAIYMVLALKPVHYRQLLVVELAASFANRLLPAGLGGLSLHGLYLYQRKHTPAQATAVVSVNNLLGIVAHLFLLTLVICFQPTLLKQLTGHFHDFHWWYVWIAIGMVVVLALWPRARRELGSFARNLLVSLRMLTGRRVVGASLCALVLTTTYTCVLYSSARAASTDLNLLQIFIVFSLGMVVGTATPTPGGLVGVEAGLFAGFTAYNVPAAPATAAVIVYRLLTYWLPLIPGVIALLAARQRRFV